MAAQLLPHGPDYPGGRPGTEEEEHQAGEQHPHLQTEAAALIQLWSAEYLEVLVGVAAEENDEEDTDGDSLDTQPDRYWTVLSEVWGDRE